MDKTIIGLLFITAGLAYGSLALDGINHATLGYLIEHNWIKLPKPEKQGKNILGPKPTIILYSAILIIIGIFILWNRKL